MRNIHYDVLYQRKMELIRRIQYNSKDPLWDLVVQIDSVLLNAEERGEFKYSPADETPMTNKRKILERLVWLVEAAKPVNEVIDQLEKLSDYFDRDTGLSLEAISVQTGCVIRDNGLYDADGQKLARGKIQDDLVFVNQHVGYCEDDFYGTMYFPLGDADGTVICIPYEC